MHWQWDGADFEFLHPAAHFPYLENESSCVLRIEAGGSVALLPGDIGEVVERILVREHAPALRADVVLVPHHGSRHSSTPGFIAATQARRALVSAGYSNRFGHPDPEVVSRWQGEGAMVGNTAATGAQRLRLDANGVTFQGERARRRRLWEGALSLAPDR